MYFSADAAVDVIGLFAQWKDVPTATTDGSQRFLADGRRPNSRFLTPSYEHTTGEDIVRQEVDEGMQLEMAKADAADFFHTFRTIEDLQQYFGLRPVSAEALAQHGIVVPLDKVDSAGRTHPRLIAQCAHECVLYGSEGSGSDDARALAPALHPAARLSSRNQPALDSAAAREPHAIVIDDVLCFRQVQRRAAVSRPHDPAVAAAEIAAATTGGDFAELTPKSGTTLQRVLARYEDVNIRTKPSKVFRLLLNAGWAWGSPR